MLAARARGVRRGSPGRGGATLAACWLLLAALCAAASVAARPAVADTAAQRVVPSSLEDAILSFSRVVESVAPTVVSVLATKGSQGGGSGLVNDSLWESFDRMFGRRQRPGGRNSRLLGSGVIVSPQGLVVTNGHVIDGASRVWVSLAEGREINAEVLLVDERLDMAVLQLAGNLGEQFPYLRLSGSAAGVKVGDLVLAVGNPYGVGQSVTSGIVSAVSRRSDRSSGSVLFIQTDAAINPGNSGGALVNSRGELVGINTSIVSPSGGSAGIGFATPSNVASLAVEAARRGHSRVVRPWSGVVTQPLTEDLQTRLGVEPHGGALITVIHKQSALSAAGLRRGDVIISLDGDAVVSPEAFEFLYTTGKLRTLVEVGYIREGRRRAVTVRLMAPPQAETEPLTVSTRGILQGAVVADLSPEVLEQLGVSLRSVRSWQGVVVLTGNSHGTFAVRRGDILQAVNGDNVVNLEQLQETLEGSAVTSVRLMRNRKIFNVRIN